MPDARCLDQFLFMGLIQASDGLQMEIVIAVQEAILQVLPIHTGGGRKQRSPRKQFGVQVKRRESPRRPDLPYPLLCQLQNGNRKQGLGRWVEYC